MKMVSFTLGVVSSIALASCGTSSNSEEKLAREKCAVCHQFPEPGMLDKKTWQKGVLPLMKFRMGLTTDKLWSLSSGDLEEVVKVLPDAPMISDEEWNKIEKYYLSNAPENLKDTVVKFENKLKQFDVTAIKLPYQEDAAVTAIEFDSLTNRILVGSFYNKLYELNNKMEVVDSSSISSPASKIIFTTTTPILTLMGVMDPNDLRKGRIVTLDEHSKIETLVIDSLRRPVFTKIVDLNNDHVNDFLVAEFGNYSGSLSIYEHKGGQYIQHVVDYLPGTRIFYIRDVDQNGLPDIVALITQGNEQISVFLNQGNFNFEKKILLSFPPVYGSSYFQLIDMNHDKIEDILYCNGDNGDASEILKPYHGIRIFINDGHYKFNNSWFFPLHGCTQVLGNDFDKDGDVDLAAISYFADFAKTPEQSLVYFENINNQLTPQLVNESTLGRWLTIHSNDYDHDGDDDILVGALSAHVNTDVSNKAQWNKQKISLLLLRNKLKQQPLIPQKAN